MSYIKDPKSIEVRSFEIITEGLAGKADHFSEEEQLIVKRLIHTTGDFDYVNIVEFQNNPIESAKEALEAGNCRIYCDTNMIVNGLNKNGLKKFGAEAYCLVADPDVAKEAKERGITRSMVGLERALKDPQTKIFVIGNAPTALFTLLEKMDKEGKNMPKLIIGVPVGFVGCPESKAELSKYNVPFIRTNGTKGGSTVAVGVMHGILYQMYERDKYFNN
ncbi:precorrin-8X methylmutase [Leptotrichia wadei]|uniref:Precorrin-8X methylmutase CbiC/CobH n=1 Tax=Leptotrichia wadei TaxID=157687 RepID=A0A510KFD0_9FUSO|nr:precorrin-8X methylmutase [Leptotrichia wadei]BBM48815.1 precorrin-8X methylmutase CbiC/CobH [Leptotrichia wadei]